MQMNVSDEELAYIYSKAEMFVFPSLYEGFGIPIVEAMSCNCPVVLSNASCFPEIAGDAAVYFDPNKSEDMAEKIDEVLQSEKLKKKLIYKGKQRAKLFTWNKNAKAIYDIYKELIGKA